MNDSNRPTAQGSLAKTPFAHLVLYLYQKRSSGTLIARTRDHGETRVLFHRGRAVAAHTEEPSTALDQGLLPLCASVDGKFEFFETDRVGSGPSIVTGMFDPLAFVAESARRFIRADVVTEVTSKFVGTELALQPGMDLARLSLTPEETHFAEPLLRGPITFEALQANQGLDPEARLRMLYVLLITKVAGPYDPQAAESFQRSGPAGTGSTPAGGAVGSDPSNRSVRPASSDRTRHSGAAWRAIASRAAEMATNRPTPAPGATASPSTPARTRSSSDALPKPSSSQPSAAGSPVPAAPPRRGVTQPLHSKPRVHSSPLNESSPARPTKPGPNPISRPLTPLPGRRPVSRSITPSRFAQPPAAREPSRPISRPLTPTAFGSTPSPLPRTTPSAPVSRVTPRPSQPDLETLDTNGKFKRVEQLCQRHAYDEALPIIRTLVEEDRKNAKQLGMLAHVLLGRTAADGQIGREIVDAVNQALRIDPDEVRALYTKARAYKRMGKEREALHYFKRTVAVDPNHLDATRELRLLLLRMSEKRKR